MYIRKLDISDFRLYKKGHTNFDRNYEDKLFNEKIPNSRYKETNYSIMKCLWYVGNPWIIFYQYDENTIIEICSFRTKRECIEYLEISTAIKNFPNLCNKYFEYLEIKKKINKELNEYI